jgi:recombination protein RecA
MVKKEKEKAKKEKVTTEASSMDVARKAIAKKYGDVIKPMSSKPSKIKTISTQSIGLDAGLGRGGLALGRVYEVFGPPGGGKTTACMKVISSAQKEGLKCAFVDAEHAADPDLFKAMGVEIEKLDYIEGYTGEENLDAAEILMSTGELDLIVIDSVTALVPQAEAESDMDQQFMGLLARLMSKALRKFVPIAGRTNCCVIFINQIRHNIGKWGNDEETPGGEALNFYSTGRIRVSGVEKVSNRIKDPDTDLVVGHRIEFSIVKNKLAAPFRKAEIDLYYGVGYDDIGEVLTFAVDLGLVEKNGSWYKQGDKNIAQGDVKMKDYLIENPDFYKELRKGVLELMCMDEYYDV